MQNDVFIVTILVLFPIILFLGIMFQIFISFSQKRTSQDVYFNHFKQNFAIVFLTWKFTLLIILIMIFIIVLIFAIIPNLFLDSFPIQFGLILLIIIFVFTFFLWLFSNFFPSKYFITDKIITFSLYDSFVFIPFSAFKKIVVDRDHLTFQLTFHYCFSKNYKGSFQCLFHSKNNIVFDTLIDNFQQHSLSLQFANLKSLSKILSLHFHMASQDNLLLSPKIPENLTLAINLFDEI